MESTLTACIFNIQKFSIHDGPGIRTTVFFKGCPLRCAWCANPESLLPRPQVLWDSSACVLCGICAGACPAGAIAVGKAGLRIDHGACTGCGDCVRACPRADLSLSGREYGIDEIVGICLQDKDFYAESGGGATLSGGEVMLQPAFALELLRRLRSHGIHTALETNGFADPAVFAEVAGAADLLLFDMKHHDARKHREGTGVDNALILANLKQAVGRGMRVLARIPVIPGYNDGPADAVGFAAALAAVPLDKVQLLPFHQFGQNKYRRLGMRYGLEDMPQMRAEDLEKFGNALAEAGVREVIF